MKVWIDGGVVEGNEARIPVVDHGLLYGDGIFEGLRVRAGRLVCLDRHIERLAVSARAVGLDLPGGLEAMRAIILETARAFLDDDASRVSDASDRTREAYVRLIVTRGDGTLGVDPTLCPAPRVLCLADSVALYSPETLAGGVDLLTSSLRRPASDVLDPRVKSLNYLNNALAKREARLRGADEALVLNGAGAVAEAAVANVFYARGDLLRTPPVTDGALDGVTRAVLLEVARELGLDARAETLGRVDLLGADEVFLCGTGAGIVAVRSLDGALMPEPRPGPITEKLSAAYLERVLRDGVEV